MKISARKPKNSKKSFKQAPNCASETELFQNPLAEENTALPAQCQCKHAHASTFSAADRTRTDPLNGRTAESRVAGSTPRRHEFAQRWQAADGDYHPAPIQLRRVSLASRFNDSFGVDLRETVASRPRMVSCQFAAIVAVVDETSSPGAVRYRRFLPSGVRKP